MRPTDAAVLQGISLARLAASDGSPAPGVFRSPAQQADLAAGERRAFNIAF